jgi:hypothetical protein
MTLDEFRADLFASTASRADVSGMGSREAFVHEMLERLRDAGEVPDAEVCVEQLIGPKNRRLAVDAHAFDEADDSIHLFVALLDGGHQSPQVLTISEARDQGSTAS